jgi:hypothetical protein
MRLDLGQRIRRLVDTRVATVYEKAEPVNEHLAALRKYAL